MLEPGVVRFGLGPLTEVVAQHHPFADLAPHLDATLAPVVAQERVLRGEDLRGDARAAGAPDDPPLVLQPFERGYVLPEYRADERLDGAVPLPADGPSVTAAAGTSGAGTSGVAPPPDVARLARALEDVVAPWAGQSDGQVDVRTTPGDVHTALTAVLADAGVAGPVPTSAVPTPTLLALLAHAGASGGVHGRRRGGAAGRAHAWWVARCATGLATVDAVDPDELEYRLEDLQPLVFRVPGAAAWRLELAMGVRAADGGEWAVAVAAFDRTEDPDGPGRPTGPGTGMGEEVWG